MLGRRALSTCVRNHHRLGFHSAQEYRAYLESVHADLPLGFAIATSTFSFVPAEAPHLPKRDMTLTFLYPETPTKHFAAVCRFKSVKNIAIDCSIVALRMMMMILRSAESSSITKYQTSRCPRVYRTLSRYVLNSNVDWGTMIAWTSRSSRAPRVWSVRGCHWFTCRHITIHWGIYTYIHGY